MSETDFEDLIAEVALWRMGFADAEAYFDQVNDVDEASVGENGRRRELIATGSAVYRHKLRAYFT